MHDLSQEQSRVDGKIQARVAGCIHPAWVAEHRPGWMAENNPENKDVPPEIEALLK